jgi:hypothetical protein
MSNILESFVPKFLVNLKKANDDIITVTTKNFSPQGDQYVVDKRVVLPSVVQTTQSLQELQPEISYTYPYKIVTPLDYDGSTIVISPSRNSDPTASQGYYVPIYFERYNRDVIKNINKNFTELVLPTLLTPTDRLPGE